VEAGAGEQQRAAMSVFNRHGGIATSMTIE
jgi:hypothetical protein